MNKHGEFINVSSNRSLLSNNIIKDLEKYNINKLLKLLYKL
jgi:hypothetical protein